MSRELGESKQVNYKQLHSVGMSSPGVLVAVFSLDKEMIPLKSRRLPKVEENNAFISVLTYESFETNAFPQCQPKTAIKLGRHLINIIVSRYKT